MNKTTKNLEFRFIFALIGLNYVLFALLFYFYPQYRLYLVGENYFIETLTAIFFFIALLISFDLAWRSSEKNYKLIYLVGAIIAFVCFGDEIGFGLSYIGIKRPMIYGVPIDGVHDFARVATNLLGRQLTIFLGLIPTMLFLYWSFKNQPQIRKLASVLPLPLIAGFFSRILLSVLLDINPLGFKITSVLEETSELNASLIFTLAVVETEINRRKVELAVKSTEVSK